MRVSRLSHIELLFATTCENFADSAPVPKIFGVLYYPPFMVKTYLSRMNSCAKLIVGEKRTRLNHELIDQLVTLRMNLNFMIHCRGNHASIGKVNQLRNEIGNDEDLYVDNSE